MFSHINVYVACALMCMQACASYAFCDSADGLLQARFLGEVEPQRPEEPRLLPVSPLPLRFRVPVAVEV